MIVHKLATTNPWPWLLLLSLNRMQINLVDLPLDENYSDCGFSQWIYQNLDLTFQQYRHLVRLNVMIHIGTKAKLLPNAITLNIWFIIFRL